MPGNQSLMERFLKRKLPPASDSNDPGDGGETSRRGANASNTNPNRTASHRPLRVSRNEVNFDELPYDPADRRSISDYIGQKLQDEIRKKYLIRGPFRPPVGFKYPQKIIAGHARRFQPPEWPKECLPSSWSIQQSMPRPTRRSRPPKAQTKHLTRKGKNVAEAEVVRIRTPMQTDAMLQAAVLRRFFSSNLLAHSCFSIRGSLIDSTTTSLISDAPCSRSPPRVSLSFSSSFSWLKRNDACREDGRGTSSGGTYLRIKMDTATIVSARSVPTLTIPAS